jgi:hypothetical protein
MNSTENTDLTIFGIAAEIDSDVQEILPASTSVSYLIKPGSSPCMKVYLTPWWDEPVVNLDYFWWAQGNCWDKEAPCFLFWRMADLFACVEMVVQSYGGGSLDDATTNEESTVFTYGGPFLANRYLPYYLCKAAYGAMMPYDHWKQFWREHARKAQRHMKRYVEESFFRVWHW